MATTTTTTEPGRLLPLAEVLAMAGCGRTYWYDAMAAGRAPRPVALGSRRVWVEAEVRRWIAERIAERDAATTDGGEAAA